MPEDNTYIYIYIYMTVFVAGIKTKKIGTNESKSEPTNQNGASQL
jgi:hypothetical protein